jgi:hypothetical protein
MQFLVCTALGFDEDAGGTLLEVTNFCKPSISIVDASLNLA